MSASSVLILTFSTVIILNGNYVFIYVHSIILYNANEEDLLCAGHNAKYRHTPRCTLNNYIVGSHYIIGAT